MCGTHFSLPFPLTLPIANERKYLPTLSSHHLTYFSNPLLIRRSYTFPRYFRQLQAKPLYTFIIHTTYTFIYIHLCICLTYLRLTPGPSTFYKYTYNVYVLRNQCQSWAKPYLSTLYIYTLYIYVECIRSASSVLVFGDAAPCQNLARLSLGLRPLGLYIIRSTYTYILYVLYIRITYTLNYKFSYFDFK